MKNKRFWLLCAIMLLLLVTGIVALSWDVLANSGFILRKHTFANAGGRLESANYALNATMGQPSVVGELNSSNMRLQAGYWAGTGGSSDLQFTAALHFVAIAGGQNPMPQPLVIYSPTNRPFRWTVTADAPWIPVKMGTGTSPGSFNIAPDITGLSPGQYTTEAWIDGGHPNASGSATITLTVYESGSLPSIMQASPGVLFFQGTAGSSSPPSQSIIVDNIGVGMLNWTAQSDMPWLSLSPTNGNNRGTIIATVNSSNLSPGNHLAMISVNDNNGNTQQIPVLLTLFRPPTLEVSRTGLVFNAWTGVGNPPSERFIVRNAGQGVFTWTASEQIPWLSLNPSTGSTPSSVETTVSIAGLSAGVYNGSITINSPTAQNSPQTINSSLYLHHGPLLHTSPRNLRLTAIAGESNLNSTIVIGNDRWGSMNWTAESNQPWLILGQTSGTVAQSTRQNIPITIAHSSLEAREAPYHGQITIHAPDAEASPQTINVVLTVASPARYCRIPQGGSDFIINNSNAKLKLENVQRTATPDGGCDLSARLVANLPQNSRLTANIAGHVDADNNFIPTSSSPLILQIANFKLQLAEGFSISDEYGIRANGGTWQIPTEFGGGNSQFNGTVEIGPQGVRIIGAQRFDLPNINYGVFQIRNVKAKIDLSTDGSYLMTMYGNMRFKANASTGQDTVIDGIEMVVDRRGVRSGKVGNFIIDDFIGLSIQVEKADIQSGRLVAQRAKLVMPQLWGGATVTVYDLHIRNNGNVAISGGQFRLPDINAGGDSFKLTSLQGGFRSVSGGYEIDARGKFQMSGIQGENSACAIWVDVTIYVDNSGAMVLDIRSLDGENNFTVMAQDLANSHLTGSEYDQWFILSNLTHNPDYQNPSAASALALRELTIGVHCRPGLAIGTTGFYLTGVEGRIRLGANLEEVRVTLWIESATRIDDVAAISAIPVTTIRPNPFHMHFEAPVYLLRSRTSVTTVDIRPGRFEASMTFNYLFLHGGFTANAGTNSGQFYFNGAGWQDVTIPRGSIVSNCCMKIPRSDTTLARIEGTLDLEGIAAQAKVLGYGIRVRFDFRSGALSIGRARSTYTITNEEIWAARQATEGQQATGMERTILNNQISFENDGSIKLTIPVLPARPDVQVTDVITPFTKSIRSDVAFALVQPVDGTLTLSLIDPNGVTYTPLSLPSNVNYEQVIDDEDQQVLLIVEEAMPGIWQIVIGGDTATIPFSVGVLENVPAPSLFELQIVDSDLPNHLSVEWRLLSAEENVPINIYANDGSITTTIAYTNSAGSLVNGTTPNLAGMVLAENIISPSDGTKQTYEIDLNRLPSGNYTIWIEALGADSIDVRCYIRATISDCTQEIGEVVTISVDNSQTFPTSDEWDPVVHTVVDIAEGEMGFTWLVSDHPDIDYYVVQLRFADPFSATQMITQTNHVYHSGIGDEVSTTFANIVPGHTYYVSVAIRDDQADHEVWSSEQAIITPQPDFAISSPSSLGQSSLPVIFAGGMSSAVPVDLEISSQLPFAISVVPDYEQLPDGIYVNMSSEIVATENQSVRVTAYVSASGGVLAGYYPLTIIARSGNLERRLSLIVEVQQGAVTFLPMINK